MQICKKLERFSLIIFFLITHFFMGVILCFLRYLPLDFFDENRIFIGRFLHRLIIILCFMFSYKKLLNNHLYKKTIIYFLIFYTFISIVFYSIGVPGGGPIGSLGSSFMSLFCDNCFSLRQYYNNIFLVMWR